MLSVHLLLPLCVLLNGCTVDYITNNRWHGGGDLFTSYNLSHGFFILYHYVLILCCCRETFERQIETSSGQWLIIIFQILSVFQNYSFVMPRWVAVFWNTETNDKTTWWHFQWIETICANWICHYCLACSCLKRNIHILMCEAYCCLIILLKNDRQIIWFIHEMIAR